MSAWNGQTDHQRVGWEQPKESDDPLATARGIICGLLFGAACWAFLIVLGFAVGVL